MTNLVIYRPFKCHIKTAMALNKNDRFNMKLRSHMMLTIIYELMGWKKKTMLSMGRRRDPFVIFYYNNGKPRVDVLIEYHYTMYFYWLKACGVESEFSDDFEIVYGQHKKECTKVDPWKKGNSLMHKMYLLKWDYEWYKRNFRKHYIYKLDKYKLTNGDELRTVNQNDLIKFADYIEFDKEV